MRTNLTPTTSNTIPESQPKPHSCPHTPSLPFPWDISQLSEFRISQPQTSQIVKIAIPFPLYSTDGCAPENQFSPLVSPLSHGTLHHLSKINQFTVPTFRKKDTSCKKFSQRRLNQQLTHIGSFWPIILIDAHTVILEISTELLPEGGSVRVYFQ